MRLQLRPLLELGRSDTAMVVEIGELVLGGRKSHAGYYDSMQIGVRHLLLYECVSSPQQRH